ncbi:MAG: NAD(P)/FAD-dependent oxidoreductase [Lachnospiraceae bacterium]|nr:NAD(P)/FAD-dependent oxidoreductase [Lachnospiraceae bacterium]
MSRVIVIGGGPAGAFAAIAAAECGHTVTLLEKNEKLGKKLFITGKGRCNVTNACDMEDLLESVIRNRKFLYSAFYGYDNHRVMDFFEEQKVPLKIERGGRVFPVSDHSSDIISALQRKLRQQKADVRFHTKVRDIEVQDGAVIGVQMETQSGKIQILEADAVVIATGGCSYASTGSTGDGYRFAKDSGHEVKPRSPSLVPFTAKEDYVRELMGLSLKNVRAGIRQNGRLLYEEFGEMLFTHFGVSGPLMLSASSVVNDAIQKGELELTVDLKPALDEEQLDRRTLRDLTEAQNKQLINAVSRLYPAKLVPVIVRLSGIAPDRKANSITKEERKRLVELTKGFPMTLVGLRGFEEAIITKGGVSVRDVNPSTMESRKVRGLYFAGEVLDVDALTGGFNLQIAWSTGYLAGSSIP